MTAKFCVYTALLGKYETLNEQPLARDSRVDFICFTDHPQTGSSTWKMVPVEPILPMDFARSSRMIKILPHRFLPEYECSLYIDNRVSLRAAPEKIYAELLERGDADMVCFQHSFRETVLDEFEEVINRQMDDLNTILEQLNVYSLTRPEVLFEKPANGGFLLRRHNRRVIAAMEDWAAHVLRYSRRDQLSFNYAVGRHALKINRLALDIRDSEYCACPPVQGREPQANRRALAANIQATYLDRGKSLDAKGAELAARRLAAQLREKDQALDEIYGSRAWRLVRLFRVVREKIAPRDSTREKVWYFLLGFLRATR